MVTCAHRYRFSLDTLGAAGCGARVCTKCGDHKEEDSRACPVHKVVRLPGPLTHRGVEKQAPSGLTRELMGERL